jgi:hypothetical protein
MSHGFFEFAGIPTGSSQFFNITNVAANGYNSGAKP